MTTQLPNTRLMSHRYNPLKYKHHPTRTWPKYFPRSSSPCPTQDAPVRFAIHKHYKPAQITRLAVSLVKEKSQSPPPLYHLRNTCKMYSECTRAPLSTIISNDRRSAPHEHTPLIASDPNLGTLFLCTGGGCDWCEALD
jgi:hypothetical protein